MQKQGHRSDVSVLYIEQLNNISLSGNIVFAWHGSLSLSTPPFSHLTYSHLRSVNKILN